MEQLTPMLQELAVKFGTTVEHLWGVLVKQVAVEVTLCKLWMAIWLWGGIALIVISVALVVSVFIRDMEDDTAVNIIFTAVLIFIFTIVISGIGYYSNYSDLLTLTTNPEY